MVEKKKQQTNNEFGLFISFNIIVFYVSMVYNKKRKVQRIYTICNNTVKHCVINYRG